jgi:hypothetical protein
MSEAKKDDADLSALLCGCGRKVRYGHFKDGEQVMSCNKYAVCLTYDQQFDLIKELQNKSLRYENTLKRIVKVNGMDYEYKAWAKAAIDT